MKTAQNSAAKVAAKKVAAPVENVNDTAYNTAVTMLTKVKSVGTVEIQKAVSDVIKLIPTAHRLTVYNKLVKQYLTPAGRSTQAAKVAETNARTNKAIAAIKPVTKKPTTTGPAVTKTLAINKIKARAVADEQNTLVEIHHEKNDGALLNKLFNMYGNVKFIEYAKNAVTAKAKTAELSDELKNQLTELHRLSFIETPAAKKAYSIIAKKLQAQKVMYHTGEFCKTEKYGKLADDFTRTLPNPTQTTNKMPATVANVAQVCKALQAAKYSLDTIEVEKTKTELINISASDSKTLADVKRLLVAEHNFSNLHFSTLNQTKPMATVAKAPAKKVAAPAPKAPAKPAAKVAPKAAEKTPVAPAKKAAAAVVPPAPKRPTAAAKKATPVAEKAAPTAGKKPAAPTAVPNKRSAAATPAAPTKPAAKPAAAVAAKKAPAAPVEIPKPLKNFKATRTADWSAIGDLLVNDVTKKRDVAKLTKLAESDGELLLTMKTGSRMFLMLDNSIAFEALANDMIETSEPYKTQKAARKIAARIIELMHA